jgi:Flp pilus assembly protein CpaB
VPIARNGVAVAGGQSRPVVRRVLTDIPVVAISSKGSGLVASGASSNISFKVNDQEAADLDFASQNGVLWLALRPTTGATSMAPSVVSMETLLLGVPSNVVLQGLGARQ